MKKLEEKDWKYWIPSAGRAENIKTVDYWSTERKYKYYGKR